MNSTELLIRFAAWLIALSSAGVAILAISITAIQGPGAISGLLLVSATTLTALVAAVIQTSDLTLL